MENIKPLKYIFVLLLYLSLQGCSSTTPTDPSKLKNVTFSYTEGSPGLSINKLIQHDTVFAPLAKLSKNFGSQPDGLWYKCKFSTGSLQDSDYSILTRGIDSLRFYLVQNGQITDSLITGGHVNPVNRVFNSSFTGFNISLKAHQQYDLYIFAKNRDYKLSLYPFLLRPAKEVHRYISLQRMYHSFYIGAMLLLLLFGLSLLLLFKNSLYLYYSLGVFYSLAMMLINYDYVYLLFDRLPPVILNKNIYGLITALISLNYFLFAKSFLQFREETTRLLNKITRPVVGLTLSVLLIYLLFNISFFHHRFTIEILVFFLCTLPVFLLYQSFKIKYKPAWIFLVATVPVLLIGIMESLSEVLKIPVQLTHNLYYSCTFFELFVLTLGLTIKFRNLKDEQKRLVEEMLEKEIRAKEEERRRIAIDLHDKLGGLVSAAKLNFSSSSEPHDPSFSKGIEVLDLTAKTIRELAYTYSSSSLLKVGVVQALKEIYLGSNDPAIHINEINFEQRLNPNAEHSLFMIVQEAISNAIRHAAANEILVFFNGRGKQVTVTIEDDGRGFELKEVQRGLGLNNMLFRVSEQLQGSINFDSVVSKGTKITIKFMSS